MSLKSKIRIIGINLLILVAIGFIALVIAEIYLRSQDSSVKAATAVNLPLYVTSKELGWEHKSDFSIPDYYGEPLSLNCRGQRSDECREPSATKTVLMLGDSFTFGINVKQSRIFPELINNALGINTEVHNAGTIGYTFDQHAAYLNKYALAKGARAPDVVVLNLFVGNDFTELRRHRVTDTENGLPAAIVDSEVFVGTSEQTKDKLESFLTPQPRFKSLSKLSQAWRALLLKSGVSKITTPTLTWPVFLADDNPAQDPNIELYWERAEDLLREMNKALSERNIKFLVSIIPMDVQVSKKYWNKYPGMPFDEEAFNAKRPQTRLAEFFKKEGIQFVDLLPLLQADSARDRLYFEKNDSHFAEAGNAAVAKILTPLIKAML